MAGQVIDGVLDLGELHSHGLGAAYEGHASENVSGVAPLATIGSGGRDEPGTFVEPQRRGRNADTGGRFADGELVTLGP